MVDLAPKPACDGLLPIEVGPLTLTEADLGSMTTIAPFKDKQADVSALLNAAHNLTYPAPNTTVVADGARVLWFGRDMAMLVGVSPDTALAQHAALTEQSDAWAAVYLTGAGAENALARLVPVDLRPLAFSTGQTCRTLVGHMTASITRVSSNRFLILVFRSMAQTLVDELHEAMEAVAARG